jgi:hypothetical protein
MVVWFLEVMFRQAVKGRSDERVKGLRATGNMSKNIINQEKTTSIGDTIIDIVVELRRAGGDRNTDPQHASEHPFRQFDIGQPRTNRKWTGKRTPEAVHALKQATGG